jgi:hypothetical protein
MSHCQPEQQLPGISIIVDNNESNKLCKTDLYLCKSWKEFVAAVAASSAVLSWNMMLPERKGVSYVYKGQLFAWDMLTHSCNPEQTRCRFQYACAFASPCLLPKKSENVYIAASIHAAPSQFILSSLKPSMAYHVSSAVTAD